MTALDIIVLVLVAGGAFFGWRRGFVHELLSVAAWIVGVMAVKAFHTPVAAALTTSVGTQAGAAALAFALTFGLSFIIFKLLAARLGGAARSSRVGPIDRLLGAGFGLLKGLIAATLIFLVANLVSDTGFGSAARPEWLTASRTYPLLNATSGALVDFVDRRRNAPPPSDEALNSRSS
ncbi:MAG TPA: CvpA family protein [Sphingomonadaceae bacterium]|nr:CvpA family protein [Sphingomonadaceae bacterium]